MIKSESSSSNNFERPKLLLFKFLAHQIHPFAYAVNTFLRPALDDCLGLMNSNPQDTFNVLLSLSQTFTRFAPESELIYDDIQQFAVKLKDTIDRCFARLDRNTVQQSSPLLETTQQSLLKIIQQQNVENTSYTDMYKNMAAVLTNLEKINSLPTEMRMLSNRQTDVLIHNGNQNKNHTTIVTPPPPPGIPAMRSKPFSPQTRSTMPLMDPMKNLSVSSQPVSTMAYLGEYEVVDTSTQPLKKSTANVASFPPRQNTSLFTSPMPIKEKPLPTSHVIASNGTMKNDQPRFPSKSNVNNKNDVVHNPQRDTPISTFSNEGSIRFGNTSAPVTPSNHDGWDDEDGDNTSRKYQVNSWTPTTNIIEQPRIDQTKTSMHPYVTDEYIQEFGTKQNRPALCGELCMTFGTPQSGAQTSCLPIGVGLSYDELTLLSCDVHRSAQHVRLFDIQSGRLKHTISSNQQMKFHRPGAVMSNARNHILIVERDSIYITESDGRYIQTISHRSIKQLYGIASFRDRYILTIDSKSIDAQQAETCRVLLFDPNNGQLVFEQNISINCQAENLLKQQYVNHIPGKILSESMSKPRFLAVHNDDIYIADLGRSLIYGATLRNQFDLTCRTVFGGHGRANGEMTEPSGLFIDSGGNIISADSKNDRIQLFSSDGQYKTTFKLNERIRRPSGICTNRAGTQFYVSCYLAGCVRAFNISY